MRKIICFLLFFIILNDVHAAKNSTDSLARQTPIEQHQSQISPQQYRDISSLSVGKIEQLTGRKMSFKEKVAWFLFKKQIKKHHRKDETPDKKQNDNAFLGFVFSLVGLLVFPLFAIPGFILSKNAVDAEKETPGTLTKSNYSLAKAGKTLSIITGIMFVLAFILILALLATWRR
jgi:hypothetical protein